MKSILRTQAILIILAAPFSAIAEGGGGLSEMLHLCVVARETKPCGPITLPETLSGDEGLGSKISKSAPMAFWMEWGELFGNSQYYENYVDEMVLKVEKKNFKPVLVRKISQGIRFELENGITVTPIGVSCPGTDSMIGTVWETKYGKDPEALADAVTRLAEYSEMMYVSSMVLYETTGDTAGDAVPSRIWRIDAECCTSEDRQVLRSYTVMEVSENLLGFGMCIAKTGSSSDLERKLQELAKKHKRGNWK